MGTRDRPVGAVGAMPGAVAVALGAAVILGPPALVSLVVTVCVIASRTRRHWHEVAAAGCAGVVVGGVVLWVLSGHPVAEHFSGLWVWLSSPTLSPVGIARDSLAAMPVGVPGGVVLGAVVIGLGEARAAGAEFQIGRAHV